MPTCLLALGANLGERQRSLHRACELLANAEVHVVAQSSWQSFEPIGGPTGQDAFLNGALRIETTLSPQALVALVQGIEKELGRQRRVRWGPRLIDVDVLLYGDFVLQTPQIEVPHPRMAFRRFVLHGAAEVAPKMVHPRIGWTMRQLLENLDRRPNYVAIAGTNASAKKRLAEKLAAKQGGRLVQSPPTDIFSTPPAKKSLQDTLDSWSKKLASLTSPCNDSADWVFGDFWFEELRAAAALLSLTDFAELATAIQDKMKNLPRQKLLILLTGNEPSYGSAATESDQIRALYSRRLGELADRPGVGPLLELPAADGDHALEEATAAIEAMA